eukprot:m.166884 g.166884  ORF g.166884 m.166884 type:complete len:148 (+) comp17759_c0_seq2:1176-1619(+)
MMSDLRFQTIDSVNEQAHYTRCRAAATVDNTLCALLRLAQLTRTRASAAERQGSTARDRLAATAQVALSVLDIDACLRDIELHRVRASSLANQARFSVSVLGVQAIDHALAVSAATRNQAQETVAHINAECAVLAASINSVRNAVVV